MYRLRRDAPLAGLLIALLAGCTGNPPAARTPLGFVGIDTINSPQFKISQSAISNDMKTSSVEAGRILHGPSVDQYLARADNYAAINYLLTANVDYSAALQLEPDNRAALIGRAAVRVRLRDFDQAFVDLNQLLRLNPNDSSVLSDRCWAHALHEELEPALTDCDRALAITPDSALALERRAFVHARARRLPQALADDDAALRLDPTDADALFGRSLVKREQGDDAGADADRDKAMALDPRIARRFSEDFGVTS